MPPGEEISSRERAGFRKTIWIFGVLIVVLIGSTGYVLLQLYRTSILLAESDRNSFIEGTRNRIALLEEYFQQRSREIEAITGNTGLQTYHHNKALGMSMEYGLAVSQAQLNNEFQRVLKTSQEDGLPALRHIGFVEESGRIVAESYSQEHEPGLGSFVIEQMRRRSGNAPALIAFEGRDGPCVFLFSEYVYKGQRKGWVFLELELQTISRKIQLQGLQKSDDFTGLVDSAGILVVGPAELVGKDLVAFLGPSGSDRDDRRFLEVFPARPGFPREPLIVSRGQVDKTGLELIRVAPKSTYLASHSPLLWTTLFVSWMAGLFVMLFFTLKGFAGQYRMFRQLEEARDTLELRVKERTAVAEQRAEALARSELALRDQTLVFESILNSMGDGVICTNEQGRLFLFNPAAERILGIGLTRSEPEKWPEIYGLYHTDGITPVKPDELSLVRASSGQATDHLEMFITNPMLTEGRYLSVIGRSLEDKDGVIRGGVAVLRDVTDARRTTLELQQAKEAAEAATVVRGEFLTRMSHEIRTPMNAVMGMIELTLRTELSPRQRELLGIAGSSAEHLLRLLNDILDFSKMDAGKLDLETRPFSLSASVGKTLKGLAVKAHERGLELIYQVAPDVPEAVLGDVGRFNQIIINLVGNSIKFTEKGEIEVRMEVESQTDTDVCLHVRVMDTGIGIPSNMHQPIFEAFIQGDGTTTRRAGGTGLGLGICSHLVRQMGGNIWVESRAERGSTFHFTVHLGVERESSAPGLQMPAEVVGLPVLVVDDNLTNRLMLRETLTNWGMKTAVADGGQEAVEEMIRAADAGEPYALVVLDQIMPDMSGCQVAARIRRDRRLASASILILASADPRESCENSSELKVSGYLTKPVTPVELLGAIVEARNTTPGAASHSAVPQPVFPRPPKSLRILVAEDNLVNQQVVVEILKERGHLSVVADNGEEVVRAYRESAPFDAILMDVEMPEMDGVQATAAIREIENMTGNRVRIIAVTAHAMSGERERFLCAGMDDYISKPIRLEHLLEVVEQGVFPDLRIGSQRTDSFTPACRVFDADATLSRLLGKRDLLKEIAGLFVEQSPDLLAAVRGAMDSRDASRLTRAAHTLKGSASTFFAREIVETALKMERLGTEEDFNAAETLYGKLEVEVARLCKALTGLAQGEHHEDSDCR